jgi:biopolymer transport protein TolQ
MREWRKSSSILKKKGGAKSASLLKRLSAVMEITGDREIAVLEDRLNILSIIGSTSPLIGLFGTVWGIMDSFGAMGASGGNSLNVIAPGVAIALSTTALGLIAAIPAVIGYNKIYGELGRYSAKLDAFQAEFTAIISRQIDENANG